MVAASASGSDVEKLKKKLRKRVTQALDEVCGEYASEQQQRTPLQQSDVSMDQTYGSCKKLVAYISDNMATSPGFVEQMDRIILACFSGASKRVLSTVATEEVWFRADAEVQQQQQQQEALPRARSHDGPRGHKKFTGKAATSSTPAVDEPVIKVERVEVSAIGGGTPADGAGLKSREVAGSVLAKRPRSRTSKKKLSTKKSLQALVVTEPKTTKRRADTASSAEESVEAGAETETDVEKEERKRPKKKPTTQKKAAVPVEDEQGLLTFKEAIGELCYQENRTPEQTEFFKERLRKSIQFVDALLCRSPPGKVCTRTCNKNPGIDVQQHRAV